MLPFQNETGDPDVEYLSDGITESLINTLSQLPGLKVISRRSAFMFKEDQGDLGEIGRKLAYDTPPEKVDVLCEGIRELVRRHPYTRKDYFHVYLNQYGPSSLDILLYIFWETPDWATELRERHRLAVDILRLTQHLGVEIAFPTQTLYLKRGGQNTPEAFDDAWAKTVVSGEEQIRKDVRDMVDAELGGKVPPPVRFATSRVDGEASEGDGE